MTIAFTKATRRKQKLKIGLTGPSGGGKSLGALALAHQLAPNGKIAGLDSENGSLSLFSDRFPFDSLEIHPPYLSSKYIQAIDAAVAAGFDVLVIDSISHQWDGDGGILQRKDDADAVPGSNHWTNWGPFTKEHNEFRAKLLSAPIHIIATMRSKMAYQQTENGSGPRSKKIEKLGLQPIQREGMEYEFTVTFDLQMDHKASASKDRTDLFEGQRIDLLSGQAGKALLNWLETAAPELPPASPPAQHAPAPVVTRPAPTPAPATNGQAVAAQAGPYAPTEKQIAFYQRLCDSQVFTAEERTRALEWLASKATRQTIKDQIDWLKTQVEQRKPAKQAVAVAVGGGVKENQRSFDEMPEELEKEEDDDLPF